MNSALTRSVDFFACSHKFLGVSISPESVDSSSVATTSHDSSVVTNQSSG